MSRTNAAAVGSTPRCAGKSVNRSAALAVAPGGRGNRPMPHRFQTGAGAGTVSGGPARTSRNRAFVEKGRLPGGAEADTDADVGADTGTSAADADVGIRPEPEAAPGTRRTGPANWPTQTDPNNRAAKPATASNRRVLFNEPPVLKPPAPRPPAAAKRPAIRRAAPRARPSLRLRRCAI